MTGCLYMLTFPSGKSYIGITLKTLDRRLSLHRSHARKGRAGAIYSAIRKYGDHSFTARKLVITDDREYLCELERRAIKAFGTRPPYGYNLTDGGDGATGLIWTENHRIAAARRRGIPTGRSGMLGKKHTEETKAKIAAAGLGRVFSDERRKRIGVTKVGNTYRLGKSCSAETREKIAAAQRGIPKSPEQIAKHRETYRRRGTVECPHCGRTGSAIVMPQWHFDNCRKAP